MRKRLFLGSASVLLVLSVVLVVWQGSFRLYYFFSPSNLGQTFIYWAVSTLIFILMVTVGWILAREFIKLYVARQAKRPGSRIRTKLVVGAMMLSCVPVFFLVLWSYEVLNVNLKAWFTTGARRIFISSSSKSLIAATVTCRTQSGEPSQRRSRASRTRMAAFSYSESKLHVTPTVSTERCH